MIYLTNKLLKIDRTAKVNLVHRFCHFLHVMLFIKISGVTYCTYKGTLRITNGAD